MSYRIYRLCFGLYSGGINRLCFGLYSGGINRLWALK